MKLERLSAGDLDSHKQVSGTTNKREAIEHLRETRNVLTPFIGDYVQEVRKREVSPRTIEDLRKVVGLRGETVPNYTHLLQRMKQDGIELDELKNFNMADTADESYDFDVKYFKRLNSPEERKFFRTRWNLIVDTLQEEGFDARNLSMAFQNILEYAQGNSKALIEYESSHPAHDLEIGLTKEIIVGRSEAARNKDKDAFPHVVVIPVGDYGVPTARKIYNTVQIMLADTQVLEKKAAELVESHKDIFAKTARGQYDLRDLDDMSKAAIKTLQEGIVTLGQAIAQLSIQEIEGYEGKPDKLIEDLVKYELPNQLGYLSPPAYIGPLSLVGQCIIDLVRKNEAGDLILNPEVIEAMQEVKEKIVGRKIKAPEWPRMPAQGRGCPVSFKGQGIETSGINELSQLFLDLYKRNPVDNFEPSTSGTVPPGS
jgi:hypothetical protein